MKCNELIDLIDIEEKALKILPRNIKNFICGGAGEELTLKRNKNFFNQILLQPRVLKGIDKIATQISLLGQKIDFPILIAPSAFQGLLHKRGELASAKAAKMYNTIFITSSLATFSMETISKCSAKNPWFQVYFYKDRKITENLVKQAYDCGYAALVVTIDAPVYGKRKSELRNPITLNKDNWPINLINAGLSLQEFEPNEITKYLSSLLDSNISWKDIDWLRSITPLPIVLKGIMSPKDARISLEYDIAALIISNHGGRQLDTVPAAIELLPEIINATQGKIDILIDGGIRSGLSIFKALAFGAKAVLVGRPILFGLSINGQKGVALVLSILQRELEETMQLCGCASIEQISREYVYNPKL